MRKVRKAMIIFVSILLGAVILVTGTISIMRLINRNKAKINTPNGIQENVYVEIGGIKQYMQIRGEDMNNPVILWLHGGPGFPLTYLTPYYQTALESDYTIVCWEQRGCGRTYYENKSEEALNIDVLLSDTDEIVDYLRERFGKDKIIIVGQSWGTVLGTCYIESHNEKVSAYIGVGQVVDFSQGKVYAAQCAYDKAQDSVNTADAQLLDRHIKQFGTPESIDNIDIKTLEEMIITSLKYLRCDGEMSGMTQMFTGITSPEMNLNDIKWFLSASNTKNIFDSQHDLVNYMYCEFDLNELDLGNDVPICFIQGEGDWTTPTGMVKEYCASQSSENIDMVVIENTGHTPFLDNPEDFCEAVKEFLAD